VRAASPASIAPLIANLPVPRPADERLACRLREIAGEHPRWGWKTTHQILLREGWTLNRKRTRRIWRQEGLRRPERKPGSVVDYRAGRNSVCERAGRTRYGRSIFSSMRPLTGAGSSCATSWMSTPREALAIRVARSCTAEDVVEIIAGLIAQRGAPVYLRSDNDPEFIA
jgi:putative transposase